ncbi:MAG: YceI family protein, partial [Flavitalea sp.]
MRILLSLLLVAVMHSGFAQQLTPVAGESKITFKIKNLGFNTNGSFSGITGKISFDEAKPAGAIFDVTVPAKTIDTDNNKRDNHLRSDDYFDVKNYPEIR